jgi:hypothetical protein
LRQGLEDSERRRAVGESARAFSERELAVDVLGPRYLEAYAS